MAGQNGSDGTPIRNSSPVIRLIRGAWSICKSCSTVGCYLLTASMAAGVGYGCYVLINRYITNPRLARAAAKIALEGSNFSAVYSKHAHRGHIIR